MEIELKAVQQRELEILKEVMAICQRHGLTYWADSGTCLGAVRHQGFIPWDDDIDIGMPRKDFDRFRQIAPEELPEHLVLWDFAEAKHSTKLFVKVHDVRTTFVEEYWEDCPDLYTGVYIDIFPYDGYPGPGLSRAALNVRLAVLKWINWALRIPDREVAGLDKLRLFAVKLLRRLFPFPWASARMEKLLRRYGTDRYPSVIEAARWRFPAACVRAVKKLPFEGITLPCPEDTDLYLRTCYGDYMRLPPEEERTPKHEVAWFSLEQSYRELLK